MCDWSPAAEQLLGLPRSEAVDASARQILAPQHHERFDAVWLELLGAQVAPAFDAHWKRGLDIDSAGWLIKERSLATGM